MVFRLTGRPEANADDSDLAWAYGAAVEAAATHEAAARALAAGVREAHARENPPPRALLVACSVRAALADAPSLPLATLPPAHREVIGLARIAGLNVRQIAELLDRDAREVKLWMRAGLQALAQSAAAKRAAASA